MKISLKIALILSLLIAFTWLYTHVKTPEPRIDDAAYTEVHESDGADYVDPWCLEHNCKG